MREAIGKGVCKTAGRRRHERERRGQFEQQQRNMSCVRPGASPRLWLTHALPLNPSQRRQPDQATAPHLSKSAGDTVCTESEAGDRADATHRRDEDVDGHGGEMRPSENFAKMASVSARQQSVVGV